MTIFAVMAGGAIGGIGRSHRVARFFRLAQAPLFL
jgi:hypothetical protein